MTAQDHLNTVQFYHVSPSRNRASIARLGLRTEFSDDEDMYDEDASQRTVYVSKGAPKDFGPDDDVWKVNVKGLHREPDVEEGDYAIHSNIEPERMVLHRMGN